MKPLKVTVPEELKTDLPHTRWGKILSATPVIMAVISTMLAGLASSEMTRAQYRRSLGAQQQSKAGDQWSFFQAKRLRGAIQRNTVDMLQNTTLVRPFTAEALKNEAALAPIVTAPGGQAAAALLEKGELPPLAAAPALSANIKAALEAMENPSEETELAAALTHVTDQELADALRAARDHTQALDDATKPINQAIDRLDDTLSKRKLNDTGSSVGGASLERDFTVARLKYAAQRYEVEARLNQGIANLYELQVRKSNVAAERHHARSQRFFFGMLAAQAGVIVSTLAMATRKRNLLWGVAAAAGLIAIAFAAYVYLYV